jgi:hypothetical protein
MRSLGLAGILALALCACGQKEQPQTTQDDSQKRQSPSALDSSKPKSSTLPFPKIEPRPFDESLATPEQIAARERLEQRLTEATIENEKREAERAVQREQRIAQMKERIVARVAEADANGDGLLAQDELSGMFSRNFAESDTNGDGFLDATEQQAMLANMEERIAELGSRGGGPRGGDRRDRGEGGRGRRGRD